MSNQSGLYTNSMAKYIQTIPYVQWIGSLTKRISKAGDPSDLAVANQITLDNNWLFNDPKGTKAAGADGLMDLTELQAYLSGNPSVLPGHSTLPTKIETATLRLTKDLMENFDEDSSGNLDFREFGLLVRETLNGTIGRNAITVEGTVANDWMEKFLTGEKDSKKVFPRKDDRVSGYIRYSTRPD